MTETRFCFEDFHKGDRIPLGTKTVERDEVIDFASRYDPQPMHLDEAGGRASLLGGLAASGWHTIAMFMRLMCDNLLLRSASLGSPGIERLRWLKPVYPGDVLTAAAEVVDIRPSKSRPTVGIVHFRFVMDNQHGEPVMTMENPIMFATREAAR